MALRRKNQDEFSEMPWSGIQSFRAFPWKPVDIPDAVYVRIVSDRGGHGNKVKQPSERRETFSVRIGGNDAGWKILEEKE